MKSKYLRVGIIFLFIIQHIALFSQDVKLELYPQMIINESGLGDATLMVDEQNIAGDPLNGNGGVPVNKWKAGYNSSSYPVSAFVDLGGIYDVTNICLFDYNNTQDMQVEYGEPGNWTYLFTDHLEKYKRWKIHPVSCNTRYLRFTQIEVAAYFSEIVVYVSQNQNPVIDDLNIDSISGNNAYLSWTDVDFDNLLGNPGYFDFRYSTTEITNFNFYDKPSLSLSSTPSNSGITTTAIIPNLSEQYQYFFALKVVGDIPNSNASTLSYCPFAHSEISNVVHVNSQNSIGEYRIEIEPEMVINETGIGNEYKIADEQLISGNPDQTNYQAITFWGANVSSGSFPLSLYFDFGELKNISKIFLFDGSSTTDDLIVEYGQPGCWFFLENVSLDSFNVWKKLILNTFSRYIRITAKSELSVVNEIVFFENNSNILTEAKLFIDTSMIENISGIGDPARLADEQLLSGDLVNSIGGNPVTKWETFGIDEGAYPCYAIIDLGKPYSLSKVFLRDMNADGLFTVDAGNGAIWKNLLTDDLTGYLSWNHHDVIANTRYLRLGNHSSGSILSEIVLYGVDYMQNNIDTIPPAGINDLSIESIGKNYVSLRCTAPGDDEFLGNIVQYDVRYSFSFIDEQNFNKADKVVDINLPEKGGNNQLINISGLNSFTPYYFAFIAFDDYGNKSALSNCVFAKTKIDINGPVQKVYLSKEMIVNESVQGYSKYLVDEQGKAGDPLNGNGNFVQNRWDMNCADWHYPGSAFIDLGANYFISHICLYDDFDSNNDTVPGPVTISIGEPFNWSVVFTDSLTNSSIWNIHTVDSSSRFIQIKMLNEETRFSELVIYGYALAEPEDEPIQNESNAVNFEDLLGANVFIDDPPGRLLALGSIREYHSWKWIEGNNDTNYAGYPNNENAWYSSNTGWNFDYFYKNMIEAGIKCHPDIQKTTLWMNGNDYSNLNIKPIHENDNSLDPNSYIEHADHMFQFAARYGSASISPGLIKVDANNDPLSGLNYLEYFENWNEQDRWWDGRKEFFNPYEYAAMSSADYDGHMNTMGLTTGIKNADPNSKLVMGGIANPSIDYVKAMKTWCDYYRNGEFIWDVINVHHYCNDNPSQYSGNKGISPEEGKLKERMREFVEYRNKYLPGVEVWITEFGYDTHPNSDQRAPQIGAFSNEEVQAQWIVRSYLELAAAKVDRSSLYMLRDVDVNSEIRYHTSGLVQPKDSLWAPKLSWYYVYTLKNRLSGFHFDSEISSGNSDVLVYKFVKDTGDIAVYAIWCPTSNSTEVPAYELQLPTSASYSMSVELQDNDVDGLETPLQIVNSKVSIDVSEIPLFVYASSQSDFPVPQKGLQKLILDTSMIVDESGFGGVEKIVDEQTTVGDPLMELGNDPLTYWSVNTATTVFPNHCYIDLGKVYEIGAISIFDRNADGDLRISEGEPGNWNSLIVDKCYRYKNWNSHIVNSSTRYIRVSREEAGAIISEIVIYIKPED